MKFNVVTRNYVVELSPTQLSLCRFFLRWEIENAKNKSIKCSSDELKELEEFLEVLEPNLMDIALAESTAGVNIGEFPQRDPFMTPEEIREYKQNEKLMREGGF